MGDFDGMVALATGGASGIGAATADLLAERGARTAVLGLEPGDDHRQHVAGRRRRAGRPPGPRRRPDGSPG